MRRAVPYCHLLTTAVVALGLFAPISANAAFPGANGKIAFSCGFPSDICIANPDGTGTTNITNSPETETDPAWSADGAKIAFIKNVVPPGGFPKYEIHTMNADGTGVVQVTNNPIGANSPAWSPDGTKIAFVRNLQEGGAGLGEHIFTINIDGTNETQLTTGAGISNTGPAWSPDGSKIAFARNSADIWTMNPDGTGATNVTNRSAVGTFGPDWSPDGSRIAYTSNDDLDTINCEVCDDEVHAINVDGTNDVNLTNNSASDAAPVWSPDGTKILFFTNRDEPDPLNCTPCDVALYTMRPDGTNQTRLMTGGIPYDWQPIPTAPSPPGPQRGDYKNAAKFCNAERAYLGDAAFARKYASGPKKKAANAHGKCVSQNH
jgi:Tol biopolymer transport system component